MLEKPEEKEFHKKWESLYVFTGRCNLLEYLTQ